MKRTQILFMIIQVPVDFAMLLLAATTAYALRFTDWAVALKTVKFDLTQAQFLSIAFWVSLGWIILFAFVGLYSTNPNRKLLPDMIRVMVACSIGLALVSMYLLFTQEPFDSRFLIAMGWGLAIVYVIIGRLFVRGLKAVMYRAGLGLRRVVIIGKSDITDDVVSILKRRKELGYEVVAEEKKFTKVLAKKLLEQQVDEIIFTNPREQEYEALQAIDWCNDYHKTFTYSADIFATFSSNMQIHPLGGVPMVTLRRAKLDGWWYIVKRLFDIVISIVALLLLSPIFFVTALAILINTRGPIIYKNERVGIRGKRFFVYKFRTMFVKDCTGPQFGESGKKAEKREEKLIKRFNTRSGPIYKVGNDPRVTEVGKVLRRFSLDELPQFFNVLIGNMSIVGPRPHQPREVEGYVKQHKQAFSVKPGITGLAQISGRSDLAYEDEVRLDIFYIEHWSVLLDIIIIIKTPFILFKKRNAL